ncbi:unnamed protein product [Leptidea sinapis]|uniref:Uncharacterized protein n=1 Tax=Leptidea sinapis TaxID=189913 RepID=A0A5E4QZV2_9NEOP|nr:unnamed protein product [Leptidea sinapis]
MILTRSKRKTKGVFKTTFDNSSYLFLMQPSLLAPVVYNVNIFFLPNPAPKPKPMSLKLLVRSLNYK